MNNQEFDHKIKEHFSQREIEVSADAWGKLGIANAPKQQKTNLIWYRVAAAVILLGFGFSYLFFGDRQAKEVVDIEKIIIPSNTKELTDDSVELVTSPNAFQKEDTVNNVSFDKIFKSLNKVANKQILVLNKKQKNLEYTKKSINQVASKDNVIIEIVETGEGALFDEIIVQEQDFDIVEILKDFDIKTALNVDIASVVTRKAYKIDTQSLLQEVENDIFEEKEKRFREKVIDVIAEGVNNVSLALEND